MDTGETIELLPGDAALVRLLHAYAETRLTPDLAASSRIRARVLAVAHRRAELAGADTSRALLSAATTHAPTSAPRTAPHRRGRRLAVGLLAAAVAVGGATGVAMASQAGGPLYPTRLWSETLTLPVDPSARAVAQLDRLERRLAEATAAARVSDVAAIRMAIEAYQDILEEAAWSAEAAGDDVAAAIIETGVGQNLSILQALTDSVPSAATDAIRHAIERSGTAIDRVRGIAPGPSQGRPPTPAAGQEPPKTGGNDAGAPAPTAAPAAAPTPKPEPSRPPKKPDPEPTPGQDHPVRPDATDAPGPPADEGDQG
ncbi:MAG TPA: hypothetical protein VFJ80_09525 [Candidatus Limnocylindrales bacterium]|jgi:hypothetical protein|nr:hypothetical protein [Candidatus Limnocylindrales bacterium]